MKFRKKPVVVETFHFDGDLTVCPVWLNEAMENDVVFIRHGVMHIRTLEGIMQVSEGDIIIQGVRGELYSCKPDIFVDTYEKVK